MKLECESSHPAIDSGMTFSEAQTLDEKKFDDAIDDAEREAIDKAFDTAMDRLNEYKCKDNCERRFSVNIAPRKVAKATPKKLNGWTVYKALVFIDWTLDIECKRPTPGGGIPHGGRE